MGEEGDLETKMQIANNLAVFMDHVRCMVDDPSFTADDLSKSSSAILGLIPLRYVCFFFSFFQNIFSFNAANGGDDTSTSAYSRQELLDCPKFLSVERFRKIRYFFFEYFLKTFCIFF